MPLKPNESPTKKYGPDHHFDPNKSNEKGWALTLQTHIKSNQIKSKPTSKTQSN